MAVANEGAGIGDLIDLSGAVAAAVGRTQDLTKFVDQLILAAQLTLTSGDHDELLHDVLADLRALRGCLSTGAALAEPSRERLKLLIDGRNTAKASA